MTTRVRLTCIGAFLLAFVAAVAAAQPLDKRTTFTFTGPVAIPGVTLPAGDYLFHTTDINHRNVLQVLSADGKVAYAQMLTLEAWRSRVTYEPEVRFIETAADMPHAIRAFWSPGESLGYELMYAPEQARLLVKGAGTPVLTQAAVVPYEPEYLKPEEAVVERAPVVVAEAPPAAAPIAVAEAVEEPAVAELPKTDSPTGTLVFVGLGALLIGIFARTVRTTLA